MSGEPKFYPYKKALPKKKEGNGRADSSDTDGALARNKFVVNGRFVALWLDKSPTSSVKGKGSNASGPKVAWDEPLFIQRLRPLLRDCGWTDEDYIVPAKLNG